MKIKTLFNYRTKRIIFWVSTLWLVLGIASTGVVQLLKTDAEVDMISSLGYPEYLLTILGTWKVLGALVILIPKLPLLKEWAYAGFVFNMSGAVVSHLINGATAGDFFGPTLLLILTVVSWYFRPASRKIVSTTLSHTMA